MNQVATLDRCLITPMMIAGETGWLMMNELARIGGPNVYAVGSLDPEMEPHITEFDFPFSVIDLKATLAGYSLVRLQAPVGTMAAKMRTAAAKRGPDAIIVTLPVAMAPDNYWGAQRQCRGLHVTAERMAVDAGTRRDRIRVSIKYAVLTP